MEEEIVIIFEKLTYLKDLLKKLNIRYNKYLLEEDNEEKETLFAAMSKFTEEIVETAITINTKFLEINNDFASSYYETFSKLNKYYKIDENKLTKLAKTTGFRNRISHEYAQIDKKITINSFKNILEIYAEYIKIINNILLKPKKN